MVGGGSKPPAPPAVSRLCLVSPAVTRKWELRRRLLPRRPTQRPRWPSPRPTRLDTSASSACRCAADSTRTSTCPPLVGIAQKPFPKALKDGRVTSFSLCSLRSTYHMRSESTFRQSSVRDGVSPKDRRPLDLCTFTTAFSKWPSCSHAYNIFSQGNGTHTLTRWRAARRRLAPQPSASSWRRTSPRSTTTRRTRRPLTSALARTAQRRRKFEGRRSRVSQMAASSTAESQAARKSSSCPSMRITARLAQLARRCREGHVVAGSGCTQPLQA